MSSHSDSIWYPFRDTNWLHLLVITVIVGGLGYGAWRWMHAQTPAVTVENQTDHKIVVEHVPYGQGQ